MAQYKTCPYCGENYDAGDRHVCDPEPYQAKPYRPMDKHLAACRRKGQYIQPGFRTRRAR